MSAYYMSWNKSIDIIKNSTSGGVFTALSEYVLDRGGVVFGVAQDENSTALTTSFVENIEELEKYRKSKYYQSDVSHAYKEVKDFLDKGRWVLFSGTPCQNAGLVSFLKSFNSCSENYERLLTVDVLCHGISNELVFRSYIDSVEKKYKKKVRKVQFRDKEEGWRSSSKMRISFAGGGYLSKYWKEDPFYLGFNNNLILRPSCHMCDYACGIRYTDFTIGDYWGIEDSEVNQENLFNGIGLTLVNTVKAERIWGSDELKNKVEYREITRTEGIRKNGALIKPAKAHYKRRIFFDNLRTKSFGNNIENCLKKEIFKTRIKKLLNIDSIKKINYSVYPIKSPIQALAQDLVVEDGCNEVINDGNNNKKLPILYEQKAFCFGCYACASICPVKAITMKNDKEGFIYPVIDADKCVACKKCINTCPKRCLSHN